MLKDLRLMHFYFLLRLTAVQLNLIFHLHAISLLHNGNLSIAHFQLRKCFPDHHTGENISAIIKEVLTSYEIPDSDVSSIVRI